MKRLFSLLAILAVCLLAYGMVCSKTLDWGPFKYDIPEALPNFNMWGAPAQILPIFIDQEQKVAVLVAELFNPQNDDEHILIFALVKTKKPISDVYIIAVYYTPSIKAVLNGMGKTIFYVDSQLFGGGEPSMALKEVASEPSREEWDRFIGFIKIKNGKRV